MPAILASARRVVSDPALGPIPQSITRPMAGNRRNDSKERGREPDRLIPYALLVSIGIRTTRSLSPDGRVGKPHAEWMFGALRSDPLLG